MWYGENILGGEDFQNLVNSAEKETAGCNGLVFLPYLAGERAPIWDPEARGIFANINSQHNSGSFVRAIMEGVAFSVRHCIDIAQMATGITPDSIRLSGGGSKIPIWCNIRADICKTPIQMTKCNETSALGAVMLAGVGIGLWKDLCEASKCTVQTAQTYEPDSKNYDVYDENYYCYRELYLALKNIKNKAI